jgi:hypothetical protein
VAAVVVTVYWRADPDLWGHLRFGLDALRDRRLETTDPYSFTSDIPWLNHEWLSELAMGVAYAAGGVPGLWLLKSLLVGASLVALYRTLRDVSEPARWWIFLIIVLACAPIVITLRPQLWSVLALSTLVATGSWSTTRKLLLWPLVFVLWANSHGGWIVGLGVVAATVAGMILDRVNRHEIRQHLVLVAACAAATLINPYGIHLWTFIWSTVGLGRDIEDWQPVWQTQVSIAVLWAAVTGAILMMSRRSSRKWSAMLPAVMLGLASLKVVRLIGLYAITAAPLYGGGGHRSPTATLAPGAIALMWVAALVPAAVMTSSQLRCLPVSGYWAPDLDAAGMLMSPSVAGRLMVPFNWGQFAIWHFSPRLRVSMDGRRETVYSDAVLAQQTALDSGSPAIVPFIRSERPEYVWLPMPLAGAIRDALVLEGYRQDVLTDRSTILTRQDLPILPPDDPVAPCFP